MDRGTVVTVNRTLKMQTAQVTLFSGEVRDGVELFEPAGLTHIPTASPPDGKGAECIVGNVGDAPDHPVALVTSDRRIRPTDLAEGDTSLYRDQTTRIDLTSAGTTVKGPKLAVEHFVDSVEGYKTGGAAGLTGIITITIPPTGGVATLTVKGGLITECSGAAVLTPLPPTP